MAHWLDFLAHPSHLILLSLTGSTGPGTTQIIFPRNWTKRHAEMHNKWASR